jgi:hypothetical protein
MVRGGRGQSAIEYLIITAFAFLLLIPIVLIAYTQSARFTNDVAAAQVQKVGNQIVDAAHQVWYAGPPAKTTLTLYFPDGIDLITIQDRAIVFTMQGTGGQYEYAVYSDANLTGALPTFNGLHNVVVEATGDGVNVTEG